jgi:cobalt/nickel transport system ATP-binding protein
MNPPLVSLRGVTFSYAGGAKILDNADFDLCAGERVALVGANGAGKTTFLHVLVGLRKPSSGSVAAFGRPRRREEDFREVRARAGLLFQDPDDQLFCPTVLEDVTFGPLNLGRSRPDALDIAKRTLASLGLDGFAGRITHKLSGGEKRLVSLATVLAMEPEALLLDEPTNGLDAAAYARLIGVLRSLPQAMVLVSHDERLIGELATRAALLRSGRFYDATTHIHPHLHVHAHPHVHVRASGAHGHEGDAHHLSDQHGFEEEDHQHAAESEAVAKITCRRYRVDGRRLIG